MIIFALFHLMSLWK